jgi:hypothetical protein
MAEKDPRVDAYIEKAAPYARPILRHLRKLVHQGCPGVRETLKWGSPAFEFKGLLCGMAAFQQHATFGFWKGSLVVPEKRSAMGHFGRLTQLSDLPPDREILRWVKKAAELNASGVKRPRPLKHPKRHLRLPPELAAAFKQRKHSSARAAYESFPPGQKREYVEWITEAKTEATRAKRLATTLEWLAEGKRRNWRYERRATATPASRSQVKKTAKKAPRK